jgi:hypothetical protein
LALTETLHSVVDILGSSQGLTAMAIAAIVGIGSPVMDRLVIRRKRIQYQVLFNSKIGLSPVLVDDDGADEGTHKQAHPDLTGLVQQFERYVLRGSEGVLSSNDCLTKDLTTNAPTIECERSTTQDLINAVRATPGAIGYADMSDETTKTAIRAGQLTALSLDGRYPQLNSLPDYPLWTVEYLYTKNSEGPALQDFLSYLDSSSAQATLLCAGYTPCFSKDNVLNPLCTAR